MKCRSTRTQIGFHFCFKVDIPAKVAKDHKTECPVCAYGQH